MWLFKKYCIETPDISSITITEQIDVQIEENFIRQDEIFDVSDNTDLRGKICIRLCYEAALKRQELVRVRFNDFVYQNNTLIIYDENQKIDRIAEVSSDLLKLVNEYKINLYQNVEKWNESRLKKGKEIREDFGYVFKILRRLCLLIQCYKLCLKTQL